MMETENGELPETNERLPVFPFFVGCGRSGTTLVREIFAAHPDLAIPPESHFIARMIGRQGKHNGSRLGFSAERFLAELYAGPWLSRWGVAQEDIRKVVLSPPPADMADAIRRIFALYARMSGKPRYGDKTPRYVLHLPQLAELFPEARFVHIIRDGRDVALSQLERAWGATNPVEGALIWRRFVETGREAAGILGGRYREINYESLLDDPEAVVRSLCEFLQLPYDGAMLRYYERPSGLKTAPVRKRGGHLLLPPTKGLRDWRQQMRQQDVAAFDLIAGDLLQELGYERGVDRLTSWTRFNAGFRILGYRTRFAMRRVTRKAFKAGSQLNTGSTDQ